MTSEISWARWLAEQSRDDWRGHCLSPLTLLEERDEFIKMLSGESSVKFFSQVANALVSRDADFFEEVATSINSEGDGTPSDLLASCLCDAFFELLRELRRLPTKREVRKRAVMLNALHNLLTTQGERNPRAHFERIRELSIEERKRVEKRAKGLEKRFEGSKQTILFKNSGLSSLPSATGGQPFHNKP